MGLSLNPLTGVISGTPSRSGTVSLPVQVTDRAGSQAGNQVFTLTIEAAPQPVPFLISPSQATADSPVLLVAGLHFTAGSSPLAPQGLSAPATMTANLEGTVIELRDDGQGGDEVAGDGRYTAAQSPLAGMIAYSLGRSLRYCISLQPVGNDGASSHSDGHHRQRRILPTRSNKT